MGLRIDEPILLIGHTGFVGSAIKRYLEDKNISYLGVNRGNYDKFKGASVGTLINANGNSKKYLAAKEPLEDFKQNVVSTMMTLRDFEFESYIFISSIDVYEKHSSTDETIEEISINPLNLSNYGFDKYLAELVVEKFASSWLVLRLGGMVGEGLKKNSIYDLINRDKLWVHPDSSYQYISTKEVARIITKLVSNGYRNEIFNICGSGTISIREVAEQFLNKSINSYEWEGSVERYEVNIDKIKKIYSVQNSRDYIKSYLKRIGV